MWKWGNLSDEVGIRVVAWHRCLDLVFESPLIVLDLQLIVANLETSCNEETISRIRQLETLQRGASEECFGEGTVHFIYWGEGVS